MVSHSLALQLAASVPCDLRTAIAALAGRPVRGHLLNERLAVAAAELGITLPASPAMAICSAAPLVASMAAGRLT